jgi:PAS domain S-box-containing protein
MPDQIRVLHVDDEPGFADLVGDRLERVSDRIRVRTETGPEAGIEALATGSIDCVVSDHDMAGRNGIEFLEAVREEHPELPFILFTGKGSEEIASEAISAGVTDYLQKERGPEQFEILANRIENAVERLRSKRTAETQTRRLETLVSNLPGIVYRCRNEPGWPMEYVDGDCELLTGYPAERIEAGDVSWGEDVVHPDDRGEIRTAVEEATDGDEPFQTTYRIRTADGDGKRVWERGRRVGVSDSGAEILEGFITDVDGSETYKQRVQRYERRFEAVFDDPNLLVGLLAPDGTVRDVNRTAMEYVDAEKRDVIGDPFPETPWWDPELRADLEEWIETAASGEYVEYEAVHPSSESSRTVEGSFRPVVADGSVTSIVVSANDITERRRRERELQRRNERLDEFASFVSHDLRSPISTVSGRLELALETGGMEHVEAAAEAIDRVEDLRADIAETLRTGEVVAGTNPVDLESTMADVWATVDPPESAAFAVVDPVAVEADPDAIRRLFENLVENSIEHAGADSTVRVGATEDGFYYEDDGPGIASDDRERVFTPGFSTKDGDEGGIGMASVRQIVAEHGWEIRVRDGETLGGARFEIRT